MLRIVLRDKILCTINTAVIIIILISPSEFQSEKKREKKEKKRKKEKGVGWGEYGVQDNEKELPWCVARYGNPSPDITLTNF